MERKELLKQLVAMVRLGLFGLLLFIPQMLFAQEDSTRIARDSMWTGSGMGEFLLSPVESISFELPSNELLSKEHPLFPRKYPVAMPDFSLKESLRLPYQLNPSLLFRGDYRTGGIMKQFSHGALFGSGGQTSLPGIGRINDATLGYQHAFSRKLMFQLGLDVMKINMIHSTGQAFSTSGALLYSPSERVTFKVFGSYAIGNTYGMDTHSYGATMSLDMSERFGMEMGVQRYYDSMRGHWETVPVVIPYYNFDKFKLGLDIGGILFDILRNVVYNR